MCDAFKGTNEQQRIWGFQGVKPVLRPGNVTWQGPIEDGNSYRVVVNNQVTRTSCSAFKIAMHHQHPTSVDVRVHLKEVREARCHPAAPCQSATTR